MVTKTKLEHPTLDGLVFDYQVLLKRALEIPVCDRLQAQAKMALLFFYPHTDQHELLEAFNSELDRVRALLKDFAPMEPITIGIQMVSEEQQQFNQWQFVDFIAGIKFLVTADVESDHTIVSVATYLVEMVHTLYGEPSGEWPTLEHPLFLMATKLLAHRIGFKVNEDVHQFEPAEWLTAHGDGGDPATIGLNFDAAKLKKSVLEFYKEAPN